MTITVYWANLNEEWMRAKEPKNVLKSFFEKDMHKTELNELDLALNKCPAFNYNLKNTYEIRSLYNYSFSIDNQIVISNDFDQNFFNKHVLIRSIEKKSFSFLNKYIFFTDQDSLVMDSYIFPTFEDNEITKRCKIIPGSFDIGKWFRPLEFAFYLKDEFDEFKVNYDDVMYYIKFNTNEKIVFKQFIPNEQLNFYMNGCMNTTRYIEGEYKTLNNFYKKFTYKKKVLKEIKRNLI